MANILGWRKGGGGCSELQEWKWVRWHAKKSPLVWATVCSALQLRSVNTDQGRCEGILQQVLSVTHPVCLCDHCLRSGCFISHTHTHTRILLPQCYQRGPGAGVCPCQKVTGAPIGNPKIKGLLFPLYVLIRSLCLGFCNLLIFGFHLDYTVTNAIQRGSKFLHFLHFVRLLLSGFFLLFFFFQIQLLNWETVCQTHLGSLQLCNTRCVIRLQCSKLSTTAKTHL